MLERRKHPRHFAPRGLAFSNGEHLYTGILNDISAGGMFILSKTRLPVGVKVAILLSPSIGDQTFDGEVVRVGKSGMGIRFFEEHLEGLPTGKSHLL